MKNIILLLIGVFACNFSYAQLSADFSCVGVGYDGCCGNGFHDLSSSGTNPITSWYWDFGNGATSSDQHPYCVCYENIGFYTVCLTITDAFGNSNQHCKPNYIQRDSTRSRCIITAGISELNESDFTIFQNYASDEFYIQTNLSEKLQFTLIDCLSKPVLQNSFSKILNINLTTISSGIYIYILRSKDGRYLTGKLLKQ